MKKEKLSLELRVGIFVIATIFAVILFVFTQATSSKYRGYEIGVLFDYVSGLETGSPVRVSGVRAGEVKNIEILYEEKPKVLAKLRLRQDIKIGKHSRITIQTLGIIGEKYIEIAPSSNKEYVMAGEIVDGENPLSLERLAEASQSIVMRLNDVITDVSKLTGDEALQENVKLVVNNSASAIKRIDSAFEKIEWLADTVVETNEKTQAILSRSAPKVESLLDNTNELVVSTKTNVETTLDEIQRFAKAGTEAAESLKEIKETAVAFGEVAADMQGFIFQLQNEGLIARMMKEEELVDQIKHEVVLLHEATQQFTETAGTMNELSGNMNTIVSDLKDGKGSVGMFLRSDELYRDVSDFVKDIKENPWKMFIRRR
jgi:phospholipid/cholesterol/gamma-HCH transport system substrate-binding protein